MPPGRKRQAAEVPVTEYEKERAENIMRNNQMLKSLGVTALASLVNSSHGKGRGWAAEQSRLHESDRKNEHMADKVSGSEHDLELTRNTSMPAGSKRVMVLDEEDPPARRTRQRTRAAEEGLQDDALVVADLPTELDQIEMCNEGKLVNQMPWYNTQIGEELWAKSWIGEAEA
ncbi:hypothetical protein EJB05_34847, partial [Eragrostis curvula]